MPLQQALLHPRLRAAAAAPFDPLTGVTVTCMLLHCGSLLRGCALLQGKDLHKFYLPPDQRANDQHDEVDDSTQDKDEYLNDLLPDLAVYVKEEQKEQNSTDGGAAGSQELQPVPA